MKNPNISLNIVKASEAASSNKGGKGQFSYLDGSVIEALLSDDDGEEDLHMPDDSVEAAMQLADKKLTRMKMSEKAKQKATEAIKQTGKKNTKVSAGRSSQPKETFISAKGKGSPKIRASVKETGSDTLGNYIKSMSNHELLSKEDEIVLGRQIQMLVRWEDARMKLKDTLQRAPTYSEWAETVGESVPSLKRQVRRSQRAKAAMIEANLRLVVSIARQTTRSNSKISFNDMCQEGIIGLTKACEKFDPEKGFRFSTYAVWFIKREVKNSIDTQSRTIRLPEHMHRKLKVLQATEINLREEFGREPTEEEIAEQLDTTVEKVQFYRKASKDALSIDAQSGSRTGKGSSAGGTNEQSEFTMKNFLKDSGETPLDIASKEMLRDDVRRLIRTLKPREQAVIRLRFGLDDGDPKTLGYIAKRFSVPMDLIRRVEARAILKLKQPYRNHSVKCYVSDL
eukprot:CAMPEP_0195527668 /NCGR_PEP_ID=MMETSP0794_2-20130614/29515_1 /TAXON_ID=515487 /ORGANISM="Stephanopyxis turris, Strain CCMP 815" /LENGTH=453 /DNA_ID=CAMNT_0040658639 /DNA_START=604 /DNA_END=1965 /DNA_ORIENTATION=+